MQKLFFLLFLFSVFGKAQLNAAADQKKADSMEKWLQDSGIGVKLQKILSDTGNFSQPHDTSEHPNSRLSCTSFSEEPNFFTQRQTLIISLSEESMGSARNILALLQSAKKSGSLLITNHSERNYVASIKGELTTIVADQLCNSSEYTATLSTPEKDFKYPSGVSKEAFNLLSSWYQEEQATKKDS